MNNKQAEKNKIAFWGTDEFSVEILDKLKEAEMMPDLIVTAPDRPSGRGQKMTEPAVKIWAKKNDVGIEQPEKIDQEFVSKLSGENSGEMSEENSDGMSGGNWDLFVVASYGKIIPKEVVEMPKFGSLNVHPSLLPFYRGASPIESAILDDNKETGVTIILMDEKMDHGPILNQEVVFFEEWPKKIGVEKKLAQVGGQLLVETIPLWITGEIEKQDQDHNAATFTHKITKEMGEIKFADIQTATDKLSDDEPAENIGRQIFLKIQALNPWPGAYFFYEHNGETIRVKIKSASFENRRVKIGKVLPEGKKEMDFDSFLKGYLRE